MRLTQPRMRTHSNYRRMLDYGVVVIALSQCTRDAHTVSSRYERSMSAGRGLPVALVT